MNPQAISIPSDDGLSDAEALAGQLARERAIATRLLNLTATTGDLHALVREALCLLCDWSGCQCVGLRLRAGHDFPYFETHGFPPGFVEAEMHLCQRDPLGPTVPEGSGDPPLECLCGCVLTGRCDPALPHFTPRGSFWTNSTTQMLATAGTALDQLRVRGRCNREGYESMALVALRAGTNLVGLLQLNDRRPERFTPQRIASVEWLADRLTMLIAHHQAQAELRSSEERFRLIVETANEGILNLDADFRVAFVNPRLAAMLGYSAQELQGQSSDAFIFPEDMADHRAWMAARVRGVTDGHERRLRRKDGGTCWTTVSGTAVRDARGRFQGVFLMIVDITRQKADVEKLARMEMQLRHVGRLAMLGELMAGIAHEINQPLCTIVNFANACRNLAARAEPDLAKIRLWSEATAVAAVRGGEVVRRLSGFARISQAVATPLAVQELVDDALALVRFEIQPRKITLRKDLPERELVVRADAVQICQVLVNLLRNAVEAFDEAAVDKRITVGASETAEGVEIFVRDNGPGLAAVDTAAIFDAFYSTKPQGLGMGLAIAKTIVETHRGHIWAGGHDGPGATFHFTLPAAVRQPVP